MAISDSNEDTGIVVGVIRDLQKTVEENKQQLVDYEKRSSDDRTAFKTSIEESIVQLRKDFQRALTPFLIDSIDHKQLHASEQIKLLDRQKSEDNERLQRQAKVDRQFTIIALVLVAVVVLVVILLLVLIIRIIVISRV